MERTMHSFKYLLKLRQCVTPCMLSTRSLHRCASKSQTTGGVVTGGHACHVSLPKVTRSACVIGNYHGCYLQRRYKSNKKQAKQMNEKEAEEEEEEDDDIVDYTVPDDFEMKRLTPNRLESLLAHGLSKPTGTIQKYMDEGRVLFKGKKFTNKSYEPMDGDVFDVIHSDGEIRRVWRLEVVSMNTKAHTRNHNRCKCWLRPFPVEPMDGDVFDVIHSDGEIRRVWRLEVVAMNPKVNSRNMNRCKVWLRPFPVEI